MYTKTKNNENNNKKWNKQKLHFTIFNLGLALKKVCLQPWTWTKKLTQIDEGNKQTKETKQTMNATCV